MRSSSEAGKRAGTFAMMTRRATTPGRTGRKPPEPPMPQCPPPVTARTPMDAHHRKSPPQRHPSRRMMYQGVVEGLLLRQVPPSLSGDLDPARRGYWGG